MEVTLLLDILHGAALEVVVDQMLAAVKTLLQVIQYVHQHITIVLAE